MTDLATLRSQGLTCWALSFYGEVGFSTIDTVYLDHREAQDALLTTKPNDMGWWQLDEVELRRSIPD